jgi:hypothetical protein
MRHRRRVPCEKRAVLDGGRRLGGMLSELPVACVRGREQSYLMSGERLAPARKPSIDLGFSNTDRTQRTTDVRRGGVTRNVGPFGIDPEHVFDCQPARLYVHLVARQQQCSVDVEEHEPGQTATAESTASRSERTYCCNASGPSSATSTGREPTTMPSASSAVARAWSGVEIPKPA